MGSPLALAAKPKLIQRRCIQLTRLDTMGLWPSFCSDPTGFRRIDVIYYFLRLLFLTKDGLATYIWVLCNYVWPLCAVMAVSFCCSPNITSSPITFPFQAQDYALEGVADLSSNFWQNESILTKDHQMQTFLSTILLLKARTFPNTIGFLSSPTWTTSVFKYPVS